MVIKGLLDEDFVQYKKPSMTIMFPKCSFKCEMECGEQVCQNSALATSKDIEVDVESLVSRYMSNPISQAIVFGGLEPFDSWNDLYELISCFRASTHDDIVIYTGYKREEITDKINLIATFENVIVKFGRFIPNQDKRYDDVLGVLLASNNQYAERIS